MNNTRIMMIEVTSVDYSFFEENGLEILSNKLSVNDWRELTVKGTEKNLVHFLTEYHGESRSYLTRNEIKL